MVKAIKVMLIPNNVQKTKMFQYAGASRFAYNWALARDPRAPPLRGRLLPQRLLPTAAKTAASKMRRFSDTYCL